MFEVLSENLFFKIAVVVVALFCVVSIFTLNSQRAELESEIDEMNERVSEMNEYILSLEDELETPIDDEDYIIRIARERLNMRLPDEIVFITEYTD